jgi:hypothetical protein
VAEKLGRGESRKGGHEQGRQEGLRQGVEVACSLLGIELTDERRRELAKLDAAGLAALLVRLREQKRWA